MRRPVLGAAAAARAADKATAGAAVAMREVVSRERRVQTLLLTVQAWKASSTKVMMVLTATYSTWATKQLPLRRGRIVAAGGDAHRTQPMRQAPDEGPQDRQARSVHQGENLLLGIGGDRVSTPQGIHLHRAGVVRGARMALLRSAKHSTRRDPFQRWERLALDLADLGRGRSSKSRGG